MKTQMPFNNEIEKTKKEIEVLTKKLSFLEELSQTKTPCEKHSKEFMVISQLNRTGTMMKFVGKVSKMDIMPQR
jgi:hypothetical protein